MDRNEEIIKQITSDVYKKYKDKIIKRVDTYAEERDALKRSNDPRARKLSESKRFNEVRSEVDERVERKYDKELTDKLNHYLKRGTIKKIKGYK